MRRFTHLLCMMLWQGCAERAAYRADLPEPVPVVVGPDSDFLIGEPCKPSVCCAPSSKPVNQDFVKEAVEALVVAAKQRAILIGGTARDDMSEVYVSTELMKYLKTAMPLSSVVPVSNPDQLARLAIKENRPILALDVIFVPKITPDGNEAASVVATWMEHTATGEDFSEGLNEAYCVTEGPSGRMVFQLEGTTIAHYYSDLP